MFSAFFFPTIAKSVYVVYLRIIAFEILIICSDDAKINHFTTVYPYIPSSTVFAFISQRPFSQSVHIISTMMIIYTVSCESRPKQRRPPVGVTAAVQYVIIYYEASVRVILRNYHLRFFYVLKVFTLGKTGLDLRPKIVFGRVFGTHYSPACQFRRPLRKVYRAPVEMDFTRHNFTVDTNRSVVMSLRFQPTRLLLQVGLVLSCPIFFHRHAA